jgi:hypothetical protein
MARRLAVLVLTTIIAFAGVVTCPRGLVACTVGQQAVRDCCRHQTNLRNADCCCGGAHRTASQATDTALQPHQVSFTCIAASLHLATLAIAATGTPTAWHQLRHGLAPPDTPITQHTLLLL